MTIEPTTELTADFGLTKREQIAAMAMQGLLSSSESSLAFHFWYEDMDDTIQRIAINHTDKLMEMLDRTKGGV